MWRQVADWSCVAHCFRVQDVRWRDGGQIPGPASQRGRLALGVGGDLPTDKKR